MTPSQNMKHDVLEKLAETMYSFKAYPEDDDIRGVAKELTSKNGHIITQMMEQTFPLRR